MSEVNTKAKKDTLTVKRERRPISGSNLRLEVRGKEDGFHYSWINEANVDAALDAGYEFVRHDVTVGSRKIDTTKMEFDSQIWLNVGKGVKAFLMRQPEKFYLEDQEGDQEKADEQMRARLGDINSDGLSGNIDVGVSLGRTSKRNS